MGAQLLVGGALVGLRLGELLLHLTHHTANERLLGGKVVVQRGDVDAGIAGYVARAQPFEALMSDALVRGLDQRVAAPLGP